MGAKFSLMTFNGDEQLAQFRVKSEQAFVDMQRNADRAMGEFLRKYGQGAVSLGSAPQASRSVPAQVRQAPTPVKKPTSSPKAAPVSRVEPKLESVTDLKLSDVSQAKVVDSLHDLKGDLGAASSNLKRDAHTLGRDAVRGTSDICLLYTSPSPRDRG